MELRPWRHPPRRRRLSSCETSRQAALAATLFVWAVWDGAKMKGQMDILGAESALSWCVFEVDLHGFFDIRTPGWAWRRPMMRLFVGRYTTTRRKKDFKTESKLWLFDLPGSPFCSMGQPACLPVP